MPDLLQRVSRGGGQDLKAHWAGDEPGEGPIGNMILESLSWKCAWTVDRPFTNVNNHPNLFVIAGTPNVYGINCFPCARFGYCNCSTPAKK